jgi:excisionase family DNA binding protein
MRPTTAPAWLSEMIDAARGEAVTIPELANALNVHEWTVRRYIRDGRLEAVKVGGRRRVARKALERFLSANAAAKA